MTSSAFYRIVVPTDFSPCAKAALDLARRLAAAHGAELVIAHAVSDAPLWSEGLMSAGDVERVLESMRERAAAELERLAAEARAGGVQARGVVRQGPAWREIVDLATDERADLVVVGTHGRGGVQRALMGSVADRVLRLAPCPVLTVREASR
jgi:nucleotide-binding universal stress UspA family protein